MTKDYHCHLLPNIDDGPATMEESLAMARTLCTAGFTSVCCTPHMIKGVYERSAAEIRSRTGQLQQRLEAESIPLNLVAGTEYYLDEYLLQLLIDPLPLDESGLLLIEIPNHAPGELIRDTCYRITCSGFTPLIAHPERCRLLSWPRSRATKPWLQNLLRLPFTGHRSGDDEASLLVYLQSIGCRFQGNIGSFAGIYGDRVSRQASVFLQGGLYDHFGSDAHHADHLADILSKGMQIATEITSQ